MMVAQCRSKFASADKNTKRGFSKSSERSKIRLKAPERNNGGEMAYRFGMFRFDSAQGLLFRGDSLVLLNQNSLRALSVLLGEAWMPGHQRRSDLGDMAGNFRRRE
jgi:hypothetical protein